MNADELRIGAIRNCFARKQSDRFQGRVGAVEARLGVHELRAFSGDARSGFELWMRSEFELELAKLEAVSGFVRLTSVNQSSEDPDNRGSLFARRGFTSIIDPFSPNDRDLLEVA